MKKNVRIMKKVKLGFFKKYNGLISLLMAVLGFATACEQVADEYGTPYAEYGTPTAKFIVKGTVKAENTDSTISNIGVVMYGDTSYTDESGNYQVETTDFPTDLSLPLLFTDIDGETNGEYQDLDTIAEFIDPEFTEDSESWYEGETEQTINVNLKPKDKE